MKSKVDLREAAFCKDTCCNSKAWKDLAQDRDQYPIAVEQLLDTRGSYSKRSLISIGPRYEQANKGLWSCPRGNLTTLSFSYDFKLLFPDANFASGRQFCFPGEQNFASGKQHFEITAK